MLQPDNNDDTLYSDNPPNQIVSEGRTEVTLKFQKLWLHTDGKIIVSSHIYSTNNCYNSSPQKNRSSDNVFMLGVEYHTQFDHKLEVYYLHFASGCERQSVKKSGLRIDLYKFIPQSIVKFGHIHFNSKDKIEIDDLNFDDRRNHLCNYFKKMLINFTYDSFYSVIDSLESLYISHFSTSLLEPKNNGYDSLEFAINHLHSNIEVEVTPDDVLDVDGMIRYKSRCIVIDTYRKMNYFSKQNRKSYHDYSNCYLFKFNESIGYVKQFTNMFQINIIKNLDFLLRKALTTFDDFDTSIDDLCAICYDEMSTYNSKSKLKCGHCYHSECFKLYLQNNSSKRCPTCRSMIFSHNQKIKGRIDEFCFDLIFTFQNPIKYRIESVYQSFEGNCDLVIIASLIDAYKLIVFWVNFSEGVVQLKKDMYVQLNKPDDLQFMVEIEHTQHGHMITNKLKKYDEIMFYLPFDKLSTKCVFKERIEHNLKFVKSNYSNMLMYYIISIEPALIRINLIIFNFVDKIFITPYKKYEVYTQNPIPKDITNIVSCPLKSVESGQKNILNRYSNDIENYKNYDCLIFFYKSGHRNCFFKFAVKLDLNEDMVKLVTIPEHEIKHPNHNIKDLKKVVDEIYHNS